MNTALYFSQLCVNPDTSYFAVNAETEKIVGATDTELVGMDMKEIGLNTEKIHSTKVFRYDQWKTFLYRI